MPGRLFAFLLVALSALATGAGADTLPLPPNLTDLSSEQGERYFLESEAVAGYFPIAANFVTQKTQAYCGVASIVMVLNALGAPAPTTPEYQPYHTFTQDNLLDARTDGVLPREILARQGMTLDQLGALLALQGVKVEVHHAGDGGLEAFRAAARAALAARDHFVIVNYLRLAIGQQIGGHISPLAAYDSRADRFLILDVARYKYPPVWVAAAELWTAMNTIDPVNDGKTRGWVVVARGDAPAAPAQ
jgi:hypothetical protein